MQLQCEELLKQVVEYIEQNIKSPILLDDITNHVSFSKFHLHRLFKALTGYSLMAYVRARKVSLSLNELIHTDYSIIDIAYEYGFEYEQSYIRAFKAHYNMTPNYVRKHKPTLEYVQQIDVSTLKRVANGFLFNPTFILKPEFYLVGVDSDIVHEENNINCTANKISIEFQEKYVNRIENVVSYDVWYGLVTYSEDPSTHNFYMPSFEVSSVTKVDEPLKLRVIPTSEYAVFKYIGFHTPQELTIIELLEIYHCADELIYNNDVYEQNNNFHFERIDASVCSEDYCEAEIYYPIRNKTKRDEGEV